MAIRLSMAAAGTLLLAACGSSDTPPIEPDPRPDILAAGNAFIELYTNPDSAIQYFTDDGVLIPPTGARIEGRAALLAHLRAGNTGGDWDQSAVRDTIFVSGDLAVERGRYRVALLADDPSADPVFVGTGPYVIHWARQDGQWKMATYIGAADP